jgi:hypothetical protein
MRTTPPWRQGRAKRREREIERERELESSLIVMMKNPFLLFLQIY